ncbi:MAG: phosphatidyl-myo-inositol alpha-mannosyltransferase [Patescibacteria group bacterium]|nr:phosphatidyl-myo-inositol alpha-mannosyltransferase [Patescibacteria group bacterium]
MLDDGLDSLDGVQQYILTLGDWLAKQGHDVHYLVGQTKRTDISKVHSLSQNVAVRFNGNKMTMPRPGSSHAIRQFLKKEAFDVLHVQMPYSPFLAGKIIKYAPSKTVLVGTFHILPYKRLQAWGARGLAWWTRRTTKRLQQIWSVSVPAQSFARQLGIESTVLPNVVDTTLFKIHANEPAKAGRQIVFLGRLVERKGCLELLKAVAELRRQQVDLEVVIGGKGPQADHLKHWVKHHGLEDVVTFKGFVDEADKPALLGGANLAIFPSLGGESFGIVLIEAMAAGAEVVLGGDNPGYASVLGSIPASLVTAHDPIKLAQQIRLILDNPKERQRLHVEQRQLVKQYDVAVVGQKLVSYYQELKQKD